VLVLVLVVLVVVVVTLEDAKLAGATSPAARVNTTSIAVALLMCRGEGSPVDQPVR
jgi:uncharacterized membrane protein YfcA